MFTESEMAQLPERLITFFSKGWAQAYEVKTYAEKKKLVIGSGTANWKMQLSGSLALVAKCAVEGYATKGRNAIKTDKDLLECFPNCYHAVFRLLGRPPRTP